MDGRVTPGIGAVTVGDTAVRLHTRALLLSTALLTILAGLAYGTPAFAQIAPGQLPTGGTVINGSVTISPPAGTELTIDQSSARAVLNWGTFDIGEDATVAFHQSGTSFILNQILDVDPTQIAGGLNSNGTVFLVNPNGANLGGTAHLNVGGLVLTSLPVDQNGFLAGNYSFDASGVTAPISNAGSITAASGGSVSMLGGAVLNQGTIIADSGTINLIAADGVDAYPGVTGLENFTITKALQSDPLGSSAAIANLGTLSANNGTINLQARAAVGLYDTLITNSGIIEATGGNILLAATGGGIVNTGTLDAGTGQISISTTGGFHSSGSQPITAATVTGSISGNAIFDGANQIGDLGSLDVGGNLQLTNAVHLGQSGSISVGGTTTIDAGSRSISLSNAGNDFTGVVNLTGLNVSISDANSLTLGSVQVASLMAEASQIRLGSDIATVGLQSYGGAVALTNNVELSSTIGDIDFRSTVDGTHSLDVRASAANVGGAIGSNTALSQMSIAASQIRLGSDITTIGLQSYDGAVTLTNDVTLRSTAGDIEFPSSVDGAHALVGVAPSGAVTVHGAIGSDAAPSGMTVDSDSFRANSTLNVAGDLSVRAATGGVVQSGAWTVGGDTTIDAGDGSITLSNAGNDFVGFVNLQGDVVAIHDTNSLTLEAIDTGNLTATSQGSLRLGFGNISGTLVADSNGGAISQSGAINVLGATTIDAGSGAIALTNAGNGFGGTVALTGSSIALGSAGDLMIASLSNGANSAVDLSAGGTLTLASQSIDTGIADLTLASNGGAFTTPGALRGHTISLTGRDGLNLANDISAPGVLTLNSDVAIVQTGGALTAAQLSIDGGNASLNSFGNAIATLGNVDLTGNLVLGTSNALSLAADMTAGGTVDFFIDRGVTVGSGRTISAQETTMHSGLLQVDGRIDGSVTINSGATLGGGGFVGSTTIEDGGTLAPGASIGALTVAGDLTLANGSFLNYELGSPGSAAGGGTSDTVLVSGHLTLNGTLDLLQSTDLANGAAGIGYYRLMTYGTLDDQGMVVGARPVADVDYSILTGGGNVDLFIGGVGDDSLQHWQGGDGTWDAASAQWLNQGGALPLTWAGNHAAFKNEPGGFDGGVVNVEGTQSFLGLQFVDNGFVLAGSGQLETDVAGSEIRVLADVSTTIETDITGAGAIIKTQDGTLILTGTNDYAGGTELQDGTLSVLSDANLGAAAGGLTFSGGTLATTASFGSNRVITLDATGRLDVAAGTTLGLSGDIAGSGDLLKTGTGTLSLSGANTFGNTFVDAGTLVGNTSSISGSIGNAGTVIFDQVTDANFAGDIVGLFDTDGTMIKQGGGVLILTGTSLLDWGVEGGELVSATDRFGGNLDIATGGAFTFDQATSGAYAGALAGTGNLFFTGGGTVLLTGDSSGFAGNTELGTGTLLVGDADGNGALGGSLDVLDGATLGGSGTVGSGPGSLLTVASGGTLAPGNSIGTLTVDGDITFASGSSFAVEVAPGGTDSDLVTVTGTATLDGGGVAHIGADGNYDIRSTYTILSAGDLTGEFETVTSDFAFLNPDLLYDYDAGTVVLELARNERDFASAASTRNQTTTAEGIDSIGFEGGHAVYDAIAQLADDTDLIRASFDALSGEVHASTATALIEDSRHIRNAANDRIRAAFNSVGASSTSILAYGPDGPVLAPAASDYGMAAWGTAFGSWGETDSDGNAASLDRNTGGLIAGADGMLGDWRVGVLAGYSQSSVKAADRAASASSDNYHLGLYGGTLWDTAQGAFALRTGLAYTWHDIEMNRTVGFTGFGDQLSAGYNAGTVQAFGELGYGIETEFARFEPFVNLAHVSLSTDGFTESGGTAALTSSGLNTSTTFTTLGIRAETDLTLGNTTANLHGMVGWRHAFGDITPTSGHAFTGSDVFAVAGNPIANNALVLEAGLDLDLTSNATFGLSYQGQFGSNAQDHGFSANLAVKF